METEPRIRFLYRIATVVAVACSLIGQSYSAQEQTKEEFLEQFRKSGPSAIRDFYRQHSFTPVENVLTAYYGLSPNQTSTECDSFRLADASVSLLKAWQLGDNSQHREQLAAMDKACPKKLVLLGARNSVRQAYELFLADLDIQRKDWETANGDAVQQHGPASGSNGFMLSGTSYGCEDMEALAYYKPEPHKDPEILSRLIVFAKECGASSLLISELERRAKALTVDVALDSERQSPAGLKTTCRAILSSFGYSRSVTGVDPGKPVHEWTDEDVSWLQALPSKCEDELRGQMVSVNILGYIPASRSYAKELPQIVQQAKQKHDEEARDQAATAARRKQKEGCRATNAWALWATSSNLKAAVSQKLLAQAFLDKDTEVAKVSGVSDLSERRAYGTIIVEATSTIDTLWPKYKALGGTASRPEDIPSSENPCSE